MLSSQFQQFILPSQNDESPKTTGGAGRVTFQYFEFIVKVILFPVQCQLQSDKNYKCLDIKPATAAEILVNYKLIPLIMDCNN